MIPPRRGSDADGARRRGGARTRGLVAAVVALLLLACGDGDDGGTRPLSDSVYVEVMARLVVLDSALSPRPEVPAAEEAADSLRGRVLDAWDVDADRLLEYARTRGSDPERMEAVWRRVHELSDSLDSAGWAPVRSGPDSGEGGDAGDDAPADTGGGAAPPDTAGPPAPADTVEAVGDAPGDALRGVRPGGLGAGAPGAAPGRR